MGFLVLLAIGHGGPFEYQYKARAERLCLQYEAGCKPQWSPDLMNCPPSFCFLRSSCSLGTKLYCQPDRESRWWPCIIRHLPGRPNNATAVLATAEQVLVKRKIPTYANILPVQSSLTRVMEVPKLQIAYQEKKTSSRWMLYACLTLPKREEGFTTQSPLLWFDTWISFYVRPIVDEHILICTRSGIVIRNAAMPFARASTRG